MINIRPVSDLRDKFTEIEDTVQRGEVVLLTKNGCGSMVLLNLVQYEELTGDIEMKLLEAAIAADADPTRLSSDEVFGQARKRIEIFDKNSREC